MQNLPGFRDFYPEDCAFRNYLFKTWREVARSFGFLEYDAPVLELTDLYKRKSGEELKTQLFRFTDQGGRDVCLRPEMTPSLVRMITARGREYKKPIKWFSISPFFRFEKPQKGRLREFYQINCDIIGDDSPAADAELISLAVALHRAFGFTKDDFYVRLSSRNLWAQFFTQRQGSPDKLPQFLSVVDKMDRTEEAVTAQKLKPFNIELTDIREFAATPADQLPWFSEVLRELQLRQVASFTELDLTIVRGLDYYTGLVFEIFDRQRENRALGGGGRYDGLISAISDGAISLPAAGFAIGDVVFGHLLHERADTKARIQSHLELGPKAFVIVADEGRRSEAMLLISGLRSQGISTDISFHPAKVARQFQQAEAVRAEFAVIVGREWPQLVLKTLANRSEQIVSAVELIDRLR
ncbi:MAG: histidine--tRNA ligase [Verrucomicrobia bacterium]|nr:histidine--tRNA ligase [Verrucomicrobiota bacterium]